MASALVPTKSPSSRLKEALAEVLRDGTVPFDRLGAELREMHVTYTGQLKKAVAEFREVRASRSRAPIAEQECPCSSQSSRWRKAEKVSVLHKDSTPIL